MDVKGPSDSHDAGGHVSPRGRELLRHQLARSLPAASEVAPNTEFSLTTEVHRLREKLRELPEVRSDVVAWTRIRLNQGYFSTRQIAERTADAVLQRRF